jgi:hypothetical protein
MTEVTPFTPEQRDEIRRIVGEALDDIGKRLAESRLTVDDADEVSR